MIRLTELQRAADGVVVRVEGNLMGEALTVLQQELHRYREMGVAAVRFDVDGLQDLSHHIASAVVWPEGIRVCFVTSRQALYHRLVNYGLTAEHVAGAA